MSDQESNQLAAAAIATLHGERAETLQQLLRLPDEKCATRVEWWGRSQTINMRLRAFAGHADDHFQHLHRLLQARGRPISEAQLLLMRAQEALAQFEVLVLSLTDAEFQAVGPVEGDWSAAQIVDHVIERERSQRAAILAGLAKETAPFSESAPDGDE